MELTTIEPRGELLAGGDVPLVSTGRGDQPDEDASLGTSAVSRLGEEYKPNWLEVLKHQTSYQTGVPVAGSAPTENHNQSLLHSQ